MKSTKEIRKELAILIKEKQALCTTEGHRNNAVQMARQEINIKYGKEWREQDIYKPFERNNTKYQEPSIYDDHQFGEHWMD